MDESDEDDIVARALGEWCLADGEDDFGEQAREALVDVATAALLWKARREQAQEDERPTEEDTCSAALPRAAPPARKSPPPPPAAQDHPTPVRPTPPREAKTQVASPSPKRAPPAPATATPGRAASAVVIPPRKKKAAPIFHPKPQAQRALTGADLAAWRSRRRLTQAAAAKLLGIGQGTVSKAEATPTKVLGPALSTALERLLANRA